MTTEIDITKTAKVPNLVDDLTYASYKFNRLNCPDITPESWAKIFRNADIYEARFQEEQRNVRQK
jgi:hypothetical protein